MDSSLFRRLSPELRAEIWSYALADTIVIVDIEAQIKRGASVRSKSNCIWETTREDTFPALSRTCVEIRNETYAMTFFHCTFHLRADGLRSSQDWPLWTARYFGTHQSLVRRVILALGVTCTERAIPWDNIYSFRSSINPVAALVFTLSLYKISRRGKMDFRLSMDPVLCLDANPYFKADDDSDDDSDSPTEEEDAGASMLSKLKSEWEMNAKRSPAVTEDAAGVRQLLRIPVLKPRLRRFRKWPTALRRSRVW